MPNIELSDFEIDAINNAFRNQPVPWDSVFDAYDSAFILAKIEHGVIMSIAEKDARALRNWLKAPEKNHEQTHSLLDAIEKLDAALN